MTLEQLRIFLAVAEREHVTRAAEALHLTQSAVSAAIRALEERHGVTLLHRVGRRVELTPAGRAFQGEAAGVLARVQAAEQVLADLAGLKSGSLSIGASQTVASYWLPRYLVRFRQLYPGVAPHLAVGNSDAVAHWVLEGKAELGVVEGDVADAALLVTPVADDRLTIVVAPGHPWVGPHVAGIPFDPASTAWVMREPGSGTRAAFTAALPRLGLAVERLTVALELPSNEAVCAAVQAGAGAAALSVHVVAPLIAAGRLAAVGPSLPARRFSLIQHRERYRTRAVQALSDLLQAG
ncbi:LysR substrate-binding domain-containing protein [Niveispirillum sp. BGYR6]|uniref:LysR substrate-binding domain-containing protein n=1 Tax=Niveispirillum sp. BGYR6 TaxID=2971249 RepID=UPI0022B9AB4F|nr:LysR substrate-binding domain-containing protein [Niveispirillum sp. BGYR6]MDG5494986.1 LysR substrate-binding domain-containing protein [Niveispirillum sp. BGYR6]